MDAAAIEGLAVSFYRRLGFDPADPVSSYRLARTWLGADAIVRPSSKMTAPAMIFTLHGQRKIAIKRGVPAEYAFFYVAHELGHALLAEEHYVGDDEEAAADAIGGALLAPAPAVRRMIGFFGPDHRAIADEVTSTQTWAAMRIAETTGEPRAIVTPRRLYARAPESFVWPDEGTLRAWSRRPPEGVTHVRLTDDPRRVVLAIDVPIDG